MPPQRSTPSISAAVGHKARMTTTHWILTATGRDFPLTGLPTVLPDAEPQITDSTPTLSGTGNTGDTLKVTMP
eukprot:gene2699-3502_t